MNLPAHKTALHACVEHNFSAIYNELETYNYIVFHVACSAQHILGTIMSVEDKKPGSMNMP